MRPLIRRLDGEDDGVDRVALLENVAGMVDLFAPGHLGDVNEAFDAGLDFDKGAEVGEARDGAGDRAGRLDMPWRCFPRFGLKLLEAERDLFGLGIDFENADLDLLADGEHVFGLVDAAPRDVADMEQAVDAAEVDECAVGMRVRTVPASTSPACMAAIAAFLLRRAPALQERRGDRRPRLRR